MADSNASSFDLARHPLTVWDGPYDLPRFAEISDDDFTPAFNAALAAHEAEIRAIADNPQPATIDNTLVALELAGEALSRISSIFWCKAGADTNPTIQALERDIAPKMARHFSAIHMDPALFLRIDTLYRDREKLELDAEAARVLEKTWKRFVRAGASLGDVEKKRLAEINQELAGLGAQFGQNVLHDESEWVLFLDKSDLDGLGEPLIEAMAEVAEARGKPGRYASTLSRSIVEPFLESSSRRDLRKTVFDAFTNRGENGGEHDNGGIVARTLALRAEKAKLLGFETFAAYKLDDTMAKTPSAVMDLLMPVWEKARQKAAADQSELEDLAAADGLNDGIAAWDWRYYAGKLRARRLAFDDAELKSYLTLESVRAASFDVAGRLFGLKFEEMPDVAGWHPDVRVFRVTDGTGKERGTFLADPFNRPSKRSGAWMSALQSAHRLDEGEKPIVYNVMNFAKPPKGKPALLSMDEARTLFHEFGHALHGLLSEVTWPSISGTSVARDFVELPSQLYEHWLTVPDVLRKHFVHYRTGEPIPQALLEKMRAAQTADAGFDAVEFTASALVDMAFHSRGDAPDAPLRFEAETLEELQKPETIAMRHRTPHFLHVFSGDGYSAGYYSYLWSEVLDADAFKAFEETGDPFDPELAAKLKKHIYAAGGSRDPEALYVAFRGRLPSPEAMVEKRGLA